MTFERAKHNVHGNVILGRFIQRLLLIILFMPKVYNLQV